MVDHDPEQEPRGPGRREVSGEVAKKGRLSPRACKPARVLLSVALLVLIFVGLVPQFASYSEAWSHLTDVGARWWVVIAISAAFSQVSGVWLYQAALRGLRFRHGFLETQTTAAISSTVPAGGAVAIGMTYKMFTSFGCSDVDISTAVVVTGIWNLAAKLGLPVAAVALLAVTAHPPESAVGAAVFGLAVVLAAAVALRLMFRSDENAHRLGHLADRVVNWVLHFSHKTETDRVEQAVVRFRNQTVDTVHSRGRLLTWAVLASQAVAVILVLVVVRAVGIGSGQVNFAAVLTCFAVARLAGAVPVTPGGLGTVDAAFIGMLTTLGANSSHALAADLVWRLTTYMLPILLGIVCYLIWVRQDAASRLKPAGAPGSG